MNNNLNTKRSEFLNNLKQKYGDIFNNFTIIDFSNVYSFIDSHDISRFQEPGAYGIHCLTTNKTYFNSSLDVMDEIESDFYKIDNDLFEEPEALVLDYKKYGPESFLFIILIISPVDSSQWKKVWEKIWQKIDEEMDNFRQTWPFELY